MTARKILGIICAAGVGLALWGLVLLSLNVSAGNEMLVIGVIVFWVFGALASHQEN